MAKIRVEYLSNTRDANEFFDTVDEAIDWLEAIGEEDGEEKEELVFEDCEEPKSYIPHTLYEEGEPLVRVSYNNEYVSLTKTLAESGYVCTYAGKTGETWELGEWK